MALRSVAPIVPAKGNGFAPVDALVLPQRIWRNGDATGPVAWPLEVEGEVVFDFGRLITGRIYVEAEGDIYYTYASDWDQLELLHSQSEDSCRFYDVHDMYYNARPKKGVHCTGEGPQLLDGALAALRLLHVRAEHPVVIRRCWVEFSAPLLPLAGSFASSDSALDHMWHMGVYTTLLCTQKNTDAQMPIPAPGNGYVIWDGCRRDREVWGGDLRLASLTWMSAYADPEPVRNSLYMLWQGRHVGCQESGMVPGSASSHQTYYEWALWFLVNTWEYYRWTGDKEFLRSLLVPGGLIETFNWIKRKSNGRGFIEATNSWMFTLKFSGESASLAIVQVAALEALGHLFESGGCDSAAQESRAMAQQLRSVIPAYFFDHDAGAFRWLKASHESQDRYPLDANALALIYGMGDESIQHRCVEFLASEKMITPAGWRNYWPPFGEESGDGWFVNRATKWFHNDCVWPYMNCYGVWANFAKGRCGEAIAALKRFHQPHIDRDHCTLWEAMMPEGDTPIKQHGNITSLCHAWGGAGSYLLQRYVLGLRPAAVGWKKLVAWPQLGPLDFATGTLPTPYGPIEIEVERRGGSNDLRGKLCVPKTLEPTAVAQGLEVTKQ